MRAHCRSIRRAVRRNQTMHGVSYAACILVAVIVVLTIPTPFNAVLAFIVVLFAPDIVRGLPGPYFNRITKNEMRKEALLIINTVKVVAEKVQNNQSTIEVDGPSGERASQFLSGGSPQMADSRPKDGVPGAAGPRSA